MDWNGCCILAGGRRRVAFLTALGLVALALLARGRAKSETVELAFSFVAWNHFEAKVVALAATFDEVAILHDERETGRYLAWRTPCTRTPFLKPIACPSEALNYVWIDH